MSGGDRKQAYFAKLAKLLEEYPKIMIVGADNVGSNQMQKVRKSLRGKAVILMGKNTMVRKAIRGAAENNPKLNAILPTIRGNVGLVFAKDDLGSIKKIILENRVAAPAKVGAIAPNDVVVPAGPTGMEPTQTSFLQALNIQSKIVKGQVEIINDVKLIVTGQKVGSSESTLLAKLSIKPFQYGLNILTIYDEGSLYEASVLDMTDDIILGKFKSGLQNVAAVALALRVPSIAAVPHTLKQAYKNILSVSLATDFTIKQTESLKAYLANPSAFAAATPAATGGAKDQKAAPAKEEKKKEEPKEEEDDDMGLGLFD
jgi:large subunit ribosomal protein LP0